MADEVSPEDLDLINAMTAGAGFGAPADPAAAAAAPQAAAPQAAPQAAPAQAPQTPQEQATQQVAPQTEGTNAKKDPFEFFEVDGKAYTPDQLRGIANRYKGLNYEHQTKVAPISKSVEFLNALREAAQEDGTPLDDAALASLLENALTAYSTKNPTLGHTASQANAAPSGQPRSDTTVPITHGNGQSVQDQIAQWESDNAISLPPAWKDAMVASGDMKAQLGALNERLNQMAQLGQQTAQTAEQQLQQAQATHQDAGRQQLVNNLQYIQQKYQFPDEQEQDFMNFVQLRGYDTFELMDRTLAETLAQDFKNNLNAPEMERLRAMAERRQAFTGSLSPSPGGNTGGAPAPAVDPNQQAMDAMVATHNAKKYAPA